MTISNTSEILIVNEDSIPDELKHLKQWVVWKAELDDATKKYTKVLYQTSGINRASSIDSKSWDTFKNALEAYENGIGEGIGFVLTESDPYACIDIDGLESVDYLPELAEEIVNLSYSEVSPSGKGIHVWVKFQHDSEKYKNKNTKLGFEIYSNKRFITFTGEAINNLPINESEEINAFIEKVFKREQRTSTLKTTDQPGDRSKAGLSEDRLIKIAENSKSGDRFKLFMYGGWENKYQSASDADMAFCNDLAFWTKCDYSMMDSIYRKSSIYADRKGSTDPLKWDRVQNSTTYGDETLLKAIAECTSIFESNKDGFQIYVSEKDSSQIDLQKTLRDRRFKELALAIAAWEEAGGKGKKPSTISPIRCAIVLQEYIAFVLFDLEENTRLAMYQPSEGTYTNNATLIKRVISWLEPSLNEAKANEVIYHLTNQAQVKERTASRFLIPVENGVFNLQTKTLEPFTPEYVFTSKIATPYVTNPTNLIIDNWDVESWLDSIACGDAEIVNLLWQVINDSLNGNYTRKKSIFLLGEGNNGKGTFQELITNLIGVQNIATLKVNEFDERFKLSLLEGKTVVIGDDVPANVYIDDSSNFNSVVTGDRVIVEQKNKPIYSTIFRCSVIQSTNGMPKFKNKTTGTIRRIVIVPFNANFNGEIENFKIKDEYIKNDQVLQYVLHKAINMDFEKFDIPAASEIELEEFQQDNDPVVDFKSNVFDEWRLKEIPKNIVYAMYKHFCNENGYKFISDRKFHKQFRVLLSDEWVDGNKRFEYTDLIAIGDLDRMGIGFPDKSKPQKTYKNEKLKVV